MHRRCTGAWRAAEPPSLADDPTGPRVIALRIAVGDTDMTLLSPVQENQSAPKR